MREIRWAVRTGCGYLAEGGSTASDPAAMCLFPDAQTAGQAAKHAGGEPVKVLVHYGKSGSPVDVEPWED